MGWRALEIRSIFLFFCVCVCLFFFRETRRTDEDQEDDVLEFELGGFPSLATLDVLLKDFVPDGR